MIKNNYYALQTTAPESSFKIVTIERLNQTLAIMIRAMLLGSNLGSDYWSDAMTHSVHLKNRLLHQSLKKNISLCEACTNNKPDLPHPRVFDRTLCTKKLRIRRGELDTSLVTRGILLGYTPNSRNAIYHDAMTKEKHKSRHFLLMKLTMQLKFNGHHMLKI